MPKIFPILLGVLILSSTLKAQEDHNAAGQIKSVVADYFEASLNGDDALLSATMLKGAEELFIQNEAATNISFKNFMAEEINKGMISDINPVIENLQVDNNNATAKAIIDCKAFTVYSFLSLLKSKQGWKIVNSSFSRENNH